jgi:hemerythrin-like domain-containing protein
MDANIIAEQVRIEHEILKHITGALQVSLDWEIKSIGLAHKLSSVLFVAQSLQRHLERQMTLEECDGYMSVVLEFHPAWCDQIAKLKQEHGQIREAMTRIIGHLQSVSPSDEITFEDACGEIRALLRRLSEHGKKETDLLQEAFLQVDVGLD